MKKKNPVNIQSVAHDEFLESTSSDTLYVRILESLII